MLHMLHVELMHRKTSARASVCFFLFVNGKTLASSDLIKPEPSSIRIPTKRQNLENLNTQRRDCQVLLTD